MYLNGEGTAMDRDAGIRMFEAAADNGYIDAHYRYAKLTYKPVGTDMNAYFTSRKYMKSAIENCHKMARSKYDELKQQYHDWFEVLSDEDCRNMNTSKIHEIAWNFETGKNSYPKDEEEAQRWYRKAVSLYRTKPETDYISMYNYAICLHNGLGVTKDLVFANKWYLNAVKYLATLHIQEGKYYNKKQHIKHCKELLDNDFGSKKPLGALCRQVAIYCHDNNDTRGYNRYIMKGTECGNSFCTLQLAICLADGSSGLQADRAGAIMLLKTIVDDAEFGEEARQAISILSKH